MAIAASCNCRLINDSRALLENLSAAQLTVSPPHRPVQRAGLEIHRLRIAWHELPCLHSTHDDK